MRNFWQNKVVKHRGILAVCLAFMLILPLLTQVFGITEGVSATNPNLTITAVGVDNTYVEVGLNVQAQTNDFRSVGAVITYDPALLTPIDWAQEPALVTLTEQSADADTYTEDEARDDWNTAAMALDTKGPDELSGKTALAFIKGSAGYVYLAAEAPKLIEGGVETDGVISGGWNQELPESAELTEGDAATPVTTTNGVPVIVPTVSPVENPIDQSIVVRFKIKGDMAAALASIDLATGAVAVGSPLYDESGAAYFYNNKGESLAVNARILRADAGSTYFTGGGGGGVGNLIPVIFYDWDGVTLLGSTLVDKSASSEEIQAAVDTFTSTIMKDGYNPETYDATKSVYDPDYPLNAKQGYSFGKWVDMEPLDENGYEAYTGYGRGVNINNYQAATVAEPNGFTMPSGDVSVLTVQAAYVSNEELESFETISSALEHYYTVSDFEYLQFEASSTYEITVRIQRGHMEEEIWKPVPRVRKLGLRIFLTISGNEEPVYMLQELDNQDDLTASFAVNDQVQSISVAVIDLCDDVLNGGTTNWVGGTITRSNTLTLIPEDTVDDNGVITKYGFIKEAGVGFFNDLCRTADLFGDDGEAIRTNKSKSGVSTMPGNYTTADFNYSPVYGQTGATAAARRRSALANILDMYQSLEPRRNLTWDEMQEAIKRGTVWDSENNKWTNDFTGIYIP